MAFKRASAFVTRVIHKRDSRAISDSADDFEESFIISGPVVLPRRASTRYDDGHSDEAGSIESFMKVHYGLTASPSQSIDLAAEYPSSPEPLSPSAVMILNDGSAVICEDGKRTPRPMVVDKKNKKMSRKEKRMSKKLIKKQQMKAKKQQQQKKKKKQQKRKSRAAGGWRFRIPFLVRKKKIVAAAVAVDDDTEEEDGVDVGVKRKVEEEDEGIVRVIEDSSDEEQVDDVDDEEEDDETTDVDSSEEEEEEVVEEIPQAKIDPLQLEEMRLFMENEKKELQKRKEPSPYGTKTQRMIEKEWVKLDAKSRSDRVINQTYNEVFANVAVVFETKRDYWEVMTPEQKALIQELERDCWSLEERAEGIKSRGWSTNEEIADVQREIWALKCDVLVHFGPLWTWGQDRISDEAAKVGQQRDILASSRTMKCARQVVEKANKKKEQHKQKLEDLVKSFSETSVGTTTSTERTTTAAPTLDDFYDFDDTATNDSWLGSFVTRDVAC